MEFTLVQKATQTAIQYHAGARNKHDGEIYLLHVHRVAQTARGFARMFDVSPDFAEATGWLHDVVEDTVAGLWDIEAALSPTLGVTDVCSAVDLLTKVKGQDLEAYYGAIRLNPLARAVKMADMQDNFRRNHAIVDRETRLRMARKYSLGMDMLA